MSPVSSFETIMRLGYSGRGLAYLTIGGIALCAACEADPVRQLRDLPLGGGRALLALLALGLLGYGLWKLVEAALGLGRRGDGAGNRALRSGGALSGIVHAGLGLCAVYAAFGGTAGSALSPLGAPERPLSFTLLSAAFLIAGLYQLAKAWRLEFSVHLAPEARARGWIRWSGRIAYAARGLVFLLVARWFWAAGRTGEAGHAGGIGEALDAAGAAELAAAGAGLILFGLFAFVEARYGRIMPATRESV